MMYQLRWRRAVLISLLFHVLFLGSIGWMTAKFFLPTDVEQALEIELVTELQHEQDFPSDPSVAPANRQQVKTMMQQGSQSTTNPSVASSKAVIVADSMSMIATEMPTASSGGNEEGNTSSSNMSNGNSGSGTESGSANNSKTRKSSGVSRPSILSKVDPSYPESARQGAVEGTVIVKIQILKNGRPGNISIYRTSGYGELDNAAIAAVQQWRFVPAKDRDSGEALLSEVSIPVAFRLQ